MMGAQGDEWGEGKAYSRLMGLGPFNSSGGASSYPSPSSLPLPAVFSPESLPISSS